MQWCAACGAQTVAEPCTSCGADPRLDGRYVLEHLLGQGSHGMTWRARSPGGTIVAIKVVHLGQGLRERARNSLSREIAVLKQLDHPQIPHYVEDFPTRSGMTRYHCIVQEFIDGQDLLSALETHRYTAVEVMRLVAEVARVLSYLHTLTPPIIHRDVKPQNILRRSDGALVLIDFGSVRDTLLGTMGGTMSVGTIGYMAPEQIIGDVRAASDLYGLGATAVHLLTRQVPQPQHNPHQRLRWRKPPGLSSAIADFLDELLHPNPDLRPDSAERVARRAHDLAERRPPNPALSMVTRLASPEVVERHLQDPPVLAAPAPVAKGHYPAKPMLALYPFLGLVSIGATALAVIEIESIMFSGPIGAIVGLLIGLAARNRGYLVGTIAGGSVPAFASLTFLWIVISGMGPSAAQGPVPIVMGVYTLGLCVLLSIAFGRVSYDLSNEPSA